MNDDRNAKREDEKRKEKELEEGLKESFPASDPPANTRPGNGEPAPSSGYDEGEEELRESNP